MKYGVAVLGGGRIVGAHASMANELPELDLIGIAELNRDRHPDLNQRFDCDVFESIEELLDRKDVDCAAVCLPHHLHLPVSLQAIAAGKHVLIEKPMALSVAECDQIIDAAAQAGVKVTVGHHHSYSSTIVEARRRIEAGEIGQLVMGSETWLKPFHSGERPRWFYEKECGGGMWWMNAPHQVDRLLRLVGSRVVSVRGKVSNEIFNYSAADSGTAILGFENGVYATILHVGYRHGVDRFESMIAGSQGSMHVDSQTVTIWNGELSGQIELEQTRPHFEMWNDFIRAIESDEQTLTSGEYGREVIAVCEAVERSGEEGKEIRMP
ncbi:MAG: Gfo/Idh/MocA family oxidoreductase [Planctomycetota bacterium]|nr:Gfo/Idh/MocA family oxidoreductase [Planctomycetota bacterium]MDP7248682.1 Gfo/Idh/MocA family oxidoreductase [Planctomycetota bacterium]